LKICSPFPPGVLYASDIKAGGGSLEAQSLGGVPTQIKT